MTSDCIILRIGNKSGKSLIVLAKAFWQPKAAGIKFGQQLASQKTLRQLRPHLGAAMKNFKGFTLIEIMIVVIIVGVIAAFAVPALDKAVRKTEERKAILQLTSLSGRNLLEEKRTASYKVGGNEQLSVFFGINPGTMTYVYTCEDPGSTFTATATYPAPNSFTLKVTEAIAQPCCDAGTCVFALACP